MIRHIVVFKFNADTVEARSTDAVLVKQRLEGLIPLIPAISALTVGISLGLVEGHWDAALVGDFRTVADLEAYQAHPEHVAAAAFVGTLTESRAIVDFEF
jgi:hypothetical protein